MPQIIICPTSLNVGPMLVHLLRDPQVSADVVTPDLIDDFNSMLVKLYLEERVRHQEVWFSAIDTFSMDTAAYSSCLETTNSTKPGCHLLRLLGALLVHEMEFEPAKNLVINYMKTQEYHGMTEDSLKSWAEVETGIDFSQYSHDWARYRMLRLLNRQEEGIMNLYLLLFDIFELDSEYNLANKKKLIEPQSLSSYKMNTDRIRTVESADEFVEFLPWFWEGADGRAVLRDSITLLNQMWQRAMASYLEVESPERALHLYNAFKGKSKYKYALHEACHVAPPENVLDVCKGDNLDAACLEYCTILENTTPRQISRLKELFEMATQEFLPMFGMLRSCQHPNNGSVSEPHDCWTRIVTDKGVCFSTEGG